MWVKPHDGVLSSAQDQAGVWANSILRLTTALTDSVQMISPAQDGRAHILDVFGTVGRCGDVNNPDSSACARLPPQDPRVHLHSIYPRLPLISNLQVPKRTKQNKIQLHFINFNSCQV